MSEAYSPTLFLFQSHVGEVLKEGRRLIKTAPFEGLDPQALLSSSKNQHMDEFHQYFLAAMSHLRTRELACTNYEKLIRQALIDRDHMPPSLISSVLSACASAGLTGGSTSGSSSLGSASLSAAPQGHSLYIGNMIKTMLLNTSQPSSELTQGLSYLLEGTRKKYSLLYNAMIQEVYNGLLVRHREPPLKVFLNNYLEMLIDEVEAHIEDQHYAFASRKADEQTGKVDMATYQEKQGLGKFGKCFFCRREAGHYLKEEWLPICGLGCRERVKGLIAECQEGEPFSLMTWLLDNLPSGDEAVLTFLFRELQHAQDQHNLSSEELSWILKILIHQLGGQAMSKPLVGIVSLLMTKWQKLIPPQQVTTEFRDRLEHYFKVYLLEVLSIIEESPISKEYLDYVAFLSEVLRNDQVLINLFVKYDAKFLEAPILARMFNIISQYAKKFEGPLEGLANIVKSLMNRVVQRGIRDDSWKGYAQFVKKREARNIIANFNKKPAKGIEALQNLFQKEQEKEQVIASETLIQEKRLRDETEGRTKAAKEIPKKVEEKEQGQAKEEGELKEEKEEGEAVQSTHNEGQGLEIEQREKREQQVLDSDLIIHKRIGELIQEHPSAVDITEEKEKQESSEYTKGENSESNESSSIKQEEGTSLPGSEGREIMTEIQNIKFNKTHPQSQQQISSPVKKMPENLTPEQIALFIRQNLQLKSWSSSDSKIPIPIPLLSKAKVGEYFGADSHLVRKVSMEFLKEFNFETIEIDDVMRIVMNIYSLPKETQQIERIIGDLSLRLLGKWGFDDDTGIYQYIYLLLMVQTTNHNPQVKQNEKLSLENHLSMCKYINKGVNVAQAEADYKRILTNSLTVKMKYPDSAIFTDKYAHGKSLRQELYDPEEGSMTRSLLLYLWEYLVIGLVLPGNILGLQQTIILLGREGLEDQQKGFFQALRKCPAEQSQPQLLKMAIEYGNDLIGKPWGTIVSLLYSLEQSSDCGAVLDKLFTNSGQITPPRMRDILQALLQFSTSEFRRDSHYTRQLFVLRHINSLIEYNINRFAILAPMCWPLLRNYFRDICLHPRREISMPAVDSLKQLALKLVKLRIEAVPHEALLETFLHVFERSGVQMKDLIANVLLNLITSDLRGGWDAIYSILDVLDTKDQQLVVKLNSRMIGEVGLNRLGNLPRLHAICIKQLRICGDPDSTEKLLSQLWDLSSFIDEANTWIQTIRSIKDIFKISLNPDIMNIFIRLANKCIAGVGDRHPDGPRSLDREVLSEVMDVLLFLLELRGTSKTSAFLASLDSLSTLSIDFLFKHLVGSCGLLEIFRMFLGGEQKIGFTLFFKKLVKEVLLPNIGQGQNEAQLEYLSYWCVHEYMNHLPIELLNMRDKDKDFEQTLTGLLSGPEMTEGEKQHVLIEFHLSNKDNYQKCLIHLIFLDICEAIYEKLEYSTSPKVEELKSKLDTAVKESFDCAYRVNRLVLLRNFLWNNGFLAGRMLPGLLKQEHRTLLVSVRLFPLEKTYQMLKLYLECFRQTLKNLNRLKELYDPSRLDVKVRGRRKSSFQEKREEGKGLSVYLNDASTWILQSQEGVCEILKRLQNELRVSRQKSFLVEKDKSYLIILFLSILELQNLPLPVCQQISSALHQLYSIVL